MDPVTQAVLGAACAQAALFSYDKKRAWIAGGLGGMAADLDVLIQSSNGDPLLSLVYHRHFSHALSFIPIGGLLVALGLLLFKPFRQNWYLVLLAAIIGYATHGPLDSLTSYGTLLFWPFSSERISLDWISIIDPFFTFPLALGLACSIIFENRKAVMLGLLAAAVFLAFNAWQHHRVLLAVEKHAHEKGLTIEKLRAFPNLASSTDWHVAFHSGKQLTLAQVNLPLFGKKRFYALFDTGIFDTADLPEYIRQSPSLLKDFEIFSWFSDGYLIKVNDRPLHLVDGRYLISGKPATALWGIVFYPDQPHVKKTRLIPLESHQK